MKEFYVPCASLMVYIEWLFELYENIKDKNKLQIILSVYLWMLYVYDRIKQSNWVIYQMNEYSVKAIIWVHITHQESIKSKQG